MGNLAKLAETWWALCSLHSGDSTDQYLAHIWTAELRGSESEGMTAFKT